MAERKQTEAELAKQTVWGGQADWGTAMHAAKAGLPGDPFIRELLAPHRERLWPVRLGLHEVGVSFNCETRTADLCIGPAADVDAWKMAQPAACVVGTADWWAELPTGEPWIDDLKTSKWEPDTLTDQTMLYVLCRTKGARFLGWPTGRISVTWIPREDDPTTVEVLEPPPGWPNFRHWKQVSRFTLDEFEEDLVSAWHRAKVEEPPAVPGIQCEYCPSALVCTKGRD